MLKTAPMTAIFLIAKIQKILHKSQFFNIFYSKLICISIFYYLCTVVSTLLTTDILRKGVVLRFICGKSNLANSKSIRKVKQ